LPRRLAQIPGNRRDDEGRRFRPIGRLDSATTPAFEAALESRIGTAANAIVLDLAAVPFVSSAALRVFLSASRAIID
jgi:anti-anti-sigma factor